LQAEPQLSLATQVAGEYRAADLLHAIVRGLAAQPSVALARIWLRGPGDLCEKGCFLRDKCVDHRECPHSAASAGSSKDQMEQWSSIEGRYFQKRRDKITSLPDKISDFGMAHRSDFILIRNFFASGCQA
jgi:hypothetical protein